jgi:hypothetical protein
MGSRPGSPWHGSITTPLRAGASRQRPALLFTALNAVFCGAVLDLTFGRFWTGALGYGLVLRTASRDAFAATCSR